MITNIGRPLRKTYSRSHPYVVERHDWDDGSISYEIYDNRPETYRRVCAVYEDHENRGEAKRDAELIVRALNLMNGGLPT